MKKEWVTFSYPKELIEGKETQLTIRDLTPGPEKYDTQIVRAIVSSSPNRLSESDVLWIRSPVGGTLHPKPWAIKILGNVGECIPGAPHGETIKAVESLRRAR